MFVDSEKNVAEEVWDKATEAATDEGLDAIPSAVGIDKAQEAAKKPNETEYNDIGKPVEEAEVKATVAKTHSGKNLITEAANIEHN